MSRGLSAVTEEDEGDENDAEAVEHELTDGEYADEEDEDDEDGEDVSEAERALADDASVLRSRTFSRVSTRHLASDSSPPQRVLFLPSPLATQDNDRYANERRPVRPSAIRLRTQARRSTVQRDPRLASMETFLARDSSNPEF